MSVPYTFRCPKCGDFESSAPMGTKEAPCPRCQSRSVKVFSPRQSKVVVPIRFWGAPSAADVN